MKLPKRLPYELLIIAGFAMSSCSEEGKLVSRAEATDIAEDQADAAASRVRSSVEDLESRVDAIESKLNM